MSINLNLLPFEMSEEQDGLDSSRIFGEVFLPEQWLEDDVFSPFEVFFCQLNLAELSAYNTEDLLPSQGMLYFFIDTEKAKYKAVVRYFDGEVDACTDFNDGFDEEDVETYFKLDFSKNGASSEHKCLIENKEKVTLLDLSLSDDELAFMSDKYNKISFVIDKEALKRLDFSKVELKTERKN